MPSFAQAARAIRKQTADDPQRPKYHFLPPRHWMNDPNGLIHFAGRHHLFYQHNPEAAWWGNMTWGHAVSDDLLHWRDEPHALRPDRPYDAGGVFTGCCVDNGGVPTIVYTGNGAGRGESHKQVQCIATGDRDLRTWRKPEANPVIGEAPEGFHTCDFRDPYVFRHRGRWKMAVGTRDADDRGAVLLYSSADLASWRYEGVLFRGGPEETGRTFECPNFFRLGRKWVLFGSPIPLGRAVYFTGTFDGRSFQPDLRGELDEGGCLYAPQAYFDASGRCLLFGWLRENRSRRACTRAGWNGVMSLPRVLTLRADGRLDFAPAGEVELLRSKHAALGGLTVPADGDLPLEGVRGDALEIAVELAPSKSKRCGLWVRRSPRGAERTGIVYDRKAGMLAVDTTRSSTRRAVRGGVHRARFALARGEALSLRVFLDASVLEVFANGHTCLTSRVYPAGHSSIHTALFAEGGPAEARSVQAWEMAL